MSQFNAHSHSEGSFLDGQSRVASMMTRAKAVGHEYVTITDHGECNQHLHGFKEATKQGLQFIPGQEGYWMDFGKFSQLREAKVRPSPSHITLLAMTDEGLRNLWSISSKAYTDKHFYYKPVSTPEHLKEHSAGIWASDGCLLTEFADAILDDREDVAKQLLGTLADCFGDRFFMELHTWQYMEPKLDDKIKWGPKIDGVDQFITSTEANAKMTKVNQAKVRLANEMGVPLVIVNDSHHSAPEDWVNKELVWALGTGQDTDKVQSSLENMAQKADHIMGEDELHYWMSKHGIDTLTIAEAIKNSDWIASHVKISSVKPTLAMPAMAQSEHDDLANLITACQEGFKKYVTDEGLDESKYYPRLEEELTLIADKHFAGYFNMVRDYTMAFRSGGWSQYVKNDKKSLKEPKLIGPARGSAGGSLVAYLTGITIIDPIKYGTLFSRFLSPGRKGLPDVDVDVPQSDRPEMLKYFDARFGKENVCLIGTLSRNGPKATVKSLGRALGISKLPGGYADLEAINEHIEEVVQWQKQMKADDLDAEDLTWGELIQLKGSALKPYMQKYPDLFSKIEDMSGQIHHAGVHAAGVLVSGKPLMGAIPTRLTGDKRITTQFDMWEVEELGGVKLDLLGIRHLDTLSVAREMIYERHGVWIDYDRSGLSVPAGCSNVLKFGDEHFRDPDIWPAIDKGHTTGIFQVETSNCTQAAVEFHPRSEVDVADLTSIIRPGVADAGLKEPYLLRRAGLQAVEYDHPLMEKFVGPGWATNSYGVLVYQEQFIQCVEQLAGFTPDESDDLRKATGKKLMDKIMLLKQKFIDGCLANPEFVRWFRGDDALDRAKHVCDVIWASIEASGRYAFNWSHAVGYAMISTWEIWTKHHYPQEFLVALMQTDSKNINKYIREARRRGIKIMPPDINKSERKFTIEGEAIRYGLDTVRGVGSAACRDILDHRPFSDVKDYVLRGGKGADKGKIYNLICIGALDSIANRADALKELELLRATEDLAESTKANPEKLAKAIFRRMESGKYAIPVPDFDDPNVVYELEKELVGTYVTVDPMAKYVSLLDEVALREPTDVNLQPRQSKFIIGGQVTNIKPTVTKKGRNPGQEMAHITVDWNEAEFRIVVFPQVWAATKLLLDLGAPVACEVKRLDSGCCLEAVERLDLMYSRENIA
jgi:DNA polymerase-3 subunit alpha